MRTGLSKPYKSVYELKFIAGLLPESVLHSCAKWLILQAPLLLSIAKSEQSTAFIAAQALRRLKVKSYIPEWKKILFYHKDIAVQEMAGRALLDLGQQKTVENFVSQLGNGRLKSKLSRQLLN